MSYARLVMVHYYVHKSRKTSQWLEIDERLGILRGSSVDFQRHHAQLVLDKDNELFSHLKRFDKINKEDFTVPSLEDVRKSMAATALNNEATAATLNNTQAWSTMSHTFRKPVGSIHAVAQRSHIQLRLHVGCSALGCRHVGSALANQPTLDVDASPALRICRRMALRKPAVGRCADGWQSVGLALEDTPTTGLDGKLASEDKPTAASNASRYKTSRRAPKSFGGVGEVGSTKFFTLALSRPQPVVYVLFSTVLCKI
ncbi:hypothetical protein PGTUg99_012029 [Puccinia graminis f. sp. tritici]|uniref:Uncharacterized protein n=1 Tax=Puccinia graminis f. sp. tritici TaxID=56615 RepID=A0A5B0MTH2_PUCGR|nr:hypothetical protein PGTUg99_012029 [Puccinia graminis f. sp. tritici]